MPITSLSNNPHSGSIVVDLTDITDSDNDMDMDIDIDMRDDPDVQYIPPHRIGQRKPTPEIAAQSTSPHPAPSTSLAISSPSDLKPPADGQPEREIIYLDETPERNRRKEQSITMSLSAVDISRAVASFMHSTLNCRLTELFIDRLKKGLPSSYASDWCVTLSKDFDPPPWDSATVMLTIVLRYWDSIFSKVFKRGLPTQIREVIPWVMWVEGHSECPQTRQALPQSLSFKPFNWPSKASVASPADGARDKDSLQVADSSIKRNVETGKLIQLAKSMLAQCDPIECDKVQRTRQAIVDGWINWQKAHS
ncbi:hypothetical protein GGI24_000344 [Coemansia furcata]|nr:hypothetical protein GGI24_000344 [Coemansia furcata]